MVREILEVTRGATATLLRMENVVDKTMALGLSCSIGGISSHLLNNHHNHQQQPPQPQQQPPPTTNYLLYSLPPNNMSPQPALQRHFTRSHCTIHFHTSVAREK